MSSSEIRSRKALRVLEGETSDTTGYETPVTPKKSVIFSVLKYIYVCAFSVCCLGIVYISVAVGALYISGYMHSAGALVPTVFPDPLWEAQYFEAASQARLVGTRPSASKTAIPCINMKRLRDRDHAEMTKLLRHHFSTTSNLGLTEAQEQENNALHTLRSHLSGFEEIVTCIEDSHDMHAASPQACVYSIGPVIGAVNTTAARILVEVTQPAKVTLALRRLRDQSQNGMLQMNAPPAEEPAAEADDTSLYTPELPHEQSMLLAPFRAATFTFHNLAPGTSYALILSSNADCKHPLPRLPKALGGGHGYLKTLASDNASRISSDTTNRHQPANIGIISCNNIIRSTPLPKFSLYRHLASHAHTMRAVFHLGDQVYTDSGRLGALRNAYVAAQQVVAKDLKLLWNLFLIMEGMSNATSIPLPQELEVTQLFSKHPESKASLVAQVISSAAREQIVEIFRSLYRDTWGGALTDDGKVAYAGTRVVLATVSNHMLLDDHDIFDDLGDNAIDFDVRSLRRLVIDCAMIAYREFQESLALYLGVPGSESGFPTQVVPAQSHSQTMNTDWFPHVSLSQRLRTLKLMLATRTHPASTPANDVYLRPIVSHPTWRYLRLGPSDINGQVCAFMIDTRAQRDPQWVAEQERLYFGTSPNHGENALSPMQTETNSQHSHPPHGFLGATQWQALEDLLNPHGSLAHHASDCSVLILTSSIPFVFLSQPVTALVAQTHDDMLGQWSGPAFYQEQIRLLDLVTSWRQHSSGRSVVLVGGDVHTGGVTKIIPHVVRSQNTTITEPPIWQFVTSTITNEPLPKHFFYPVLGASTVSNRIGIDSSGEIPSWSRHVFTFRHLQWLQDQNYGILEFSQNGTRVSGRLVRGNDYTEGWQIDDAHNLT